MNIGIVTTWFERGAAYVSKQYKELLEKSGHKVFIYARGGEEYAKGDPAWDTPSVTWGKRRGFPVATYIDEADFTKWLKKENIETIFFNEQIWLKPVEICRELGVKTGLYIDYYTESSISAHHIFDFLICNTKKHYSAFKWHPQCFYVPWGTDTELFNTSEKRKASSKIRFFHSAGMSPYRKGTDLLINAYAKALDDKEFKDNSSLIIHSQKPIKEYFNNLENQSETLKHLEKIIDFGDVKLIEQTVSAPGLYHLGDIYVYPSRLEGIGLTIAEALSCGMPVIVPDDAPMNEFPPETGSHKIKVAKFFSRADGYYWPQNEVDVDHLSDSLIECVKNKDHISDHSKSSRVHAVHNLNWENNSKPITEIFERTKITTPSKEKISYAVKLHSKKYPLIHKHTLTYSAAFTIAKYFKKTISE
ncbi:hypothetical protein PS726_04240 [Pseudomonas fluorescens]|uniref:glycosyltransferase family 4 protein n=1 Tax=Pseudomonas fluorescens TaxID=294 RepID=UPI000FB25C7B|nr:glycosyltransferase family 4 protein [Pseudomonas fluorescens]VVO21326.1 hypothetical protein PS726_04240 [Pseudomonas fluorescens]VVP16549.1 hypothetical protein PS843_03553 [Pseudomonas fluorescens]